MSAPLKLGAGSVILAKTVCRAHIVDILHRHFIHRHLSYVPTCILSRSPILNSTDHTIKVYSGERAIIGGFVLGSCQTCYRQHIKLIHTTQSFGKAGLVLGIETSCDDTGVAVVDTDKNVIGDSIHSQTKTHISMGGIIPPIARDLHKENIENVTDQCLKNADIVMEDVDAVAVTVKPGLSLSLLVGLGYAKKLAFQYGKPLIPIHHMEAHALTIRLTASVDYPYLVLLISGGHCLLAVVRGVNEFLLIGKGLDDAPGEVYDKIARELKVKNFEGFEQISGGQAIEKLAINGDPTAFKLVHVRTHYQDCNFSFAGIKASLKKVIHEQELNYGIEGGQVLPNISDICATFQYTVLTHLAKRVQRAIAYCIAKGYLPDNQRTLVLSGGVASNTFIRNGLETVCNSYDCQLLCPPPHLCTDNGVMIAWNGIEKFVQGVDVIEDFHSIGIQPKCPLGVDVTEEVASCQLKLPRVKLL